MLSRENVAEHISSITGESPELISPGSLKAPNGRLVQGFAALTKGFLCFAFESKGGEPQILSFPKSEVEFVKSDIGVLGKTFEIRAMNERYQLGGLSLDFEQAIGAGFPRASAAAGPPSQPSGGVFSRPGRGEGRGSFRPPEAMQYGPGSTGSRGPVVAMVISIALVAALAAVGFLFYSSQRRGKEKETAARAVKARKLARVSSAETAAKQGAASTSAMVLEDGRGNVLFRITRQEAGKYKVKTSGGKWKIKVESDRVKVKNSSGDTLVKVKKKDYGFKITGANDETLLKGKYRGAGFKVKTDDAELGKVKPVGGGYEVTDASGSLVGRVVAEGNSIKVEDADGDTVFVVRSASAKAAAFLLYLDDRLDAQAGVLVYFVEF